MFYQFQMFDLHVCHLPPSGWLFFCSELNCLRKYLVPQRSFFLLPRYLFVSWNEFFLLSRHLFVSRNELFLLPRYLFQSQKELFPVLDSKLDPKFYFNRILLKITFREGEFKKWSIEYGPRPAAGFRIIDHTGPPGGWRAEKDSVFFSIKYPFSFFQPLAPRSPRPPPWHLTKAGIRIWPHSPLFVKWFFIR